MKLLKLVSLALLFVLIGCSSEHDLVGKWEGYGLYRSVAIYPNHTAAIDDWAASWTEVDKKTIAITFGGNRKTTYEFTTKGKGAVLTAGAEGSWSFTRIR